MAGVGYVSTFRTVRGRNDVEHKTTVEREGKRDAAPKFFVKCACGWRSQQLSTAGMAASVAAQHIERPDPTGSSV